MMTGETSPAGTQGLAVGAVPVRTTGSGCNKSRAILPGDSAQFAEFLRAQLIRSAQPGRRTAECGSGVKFSTHALQRIRSRGIELTDQQRQLLAEAVDAAASKGAREALILLERTALVVSIKNRTVITAMPYQEYKQHIFTNIDSAVLL